MSDPRLRIATGKRDRREDALAGFVHHRLAEGGAVVGLEGAAEEDDAVDRPAVIAHDREARLEGQEEEARQRQTGRRSGSAPCTGPQGRGRSAAGAGRGAARSPTAIRATRRFDGVARNHATLEAV